MNILSFDKQIAAIAALTEGCSIRSTERLTGIHRDTIMRLGLRVGQGCEHVHNHYMRELSVPIIQMDELWSYVGKKQKRLKPEDDTVKGDQYVFTALDSTNKAILSYLVGKRTRENTEAICMDVRERVLGAPMVFTDAFHAYENAIENAFGADVHYGQVIKKYVGEPAKDAARRYSPGTVVSIEKRRVRGNPPAALTSTSHVERSNLTVRMGSRRFTRLTNGFSKKLENHKAAVALIMAHYNFCRVHETLRITPAMALGVTDHIWNIAELIEESTQLHQPPQGKRVGSFRVIDGGLS